LGSTLHVLKIVRHGTIPTPSVWAVPIVDGGKNARCITEISPKCGFSKSYGSGHLCEHPDRERIVARTLAERKALDAAALKKLKKLARRPGRANRRLQMTAKDSGIVGVDAGNVRTINKKAGDRPANVELNAKG